MSRNCGASVNNDSIGSLDMNQLALLARLQQMPNQNLAAMKAPQKQQLSTLETQQLLTLLTSQSQQPAPSSASLPMGINNHPNGSSSISFQDQIKRLSELVQDSGQQSRPGRLGLPNNSLPPATIITDNQMKTGSQKVEKKRRRGRTGTFPQKLHQMLDDMEQVCRCT